MPAPVASRRRLTSAAVKSAMSFPYVVRNGTPVRPSAVLGALGAGVRVAGRGHALDRGDLGRGDRGGLGRGLRELGRRGGGLGGSSLGRATGQQLALPVGQRLVAADGRG